MLVLCSLVDDVNHLCLCFISLRGPTCTLWSFGWCQSSLSQFYLSRWAYLYFVALWMVSVIIVSILFLYVGLLVLGGLVDGVSHHCLCFISLGGPTCTLWPGGWCQSSLSLFYFSRWAYLYFVAWWMLSVIIVSVLFLQVGLLVLCGLVDGVSHHCLYFIYLGGPTCTLWPGG